MKLVQPITAITANPMTAWAGDIPPFFVRLPGVAEIVGRKLRALANGRQVLCVTHLPQVAALAHQQCQVIKSTTGETTRTRVSRLDSQERIDEIARMLGGVKITRQTRGHAEEMIKMAIETEKPVKRSPRKTSA